MTGLVQVERSACPRVQGLIPAGIGHLAFSLGVLEGRMPGQLWVDDAVAPRSAIVMSDADFCLAFGEPRPDLVRESLPVMLAANRAEKPELWATTPQWARALTFLGAPQSRNEYHFEGLPPEAAARSLPPRYNLAPIDARIAHLFEGAVDPWVVNAVWGGPERFAEQAFGWAVLTAESALASFCATCAIGGGEAEIEIGTSEAHRRRGLAAVAGARFIEDCLARGLVPAWTCATRNTGSERLAEILGFRFARRITGYALSAPSPHRESTMNDPQS